MHKGENAYRILMENFERKGLTEERHIEMRMRLTWILNKQEGMVWVEFV